MFNPIAFLQKIKFQKSFLLENEELFEKFGLKMETKQEVDEISQTLIETKKIYKLKTKKLLKQDKIRFRLLFPQEIVYYLHNCGFQVIDQFGKYFLNYTALDYTRIITVAKKS